MQLRVYMFRSGIMTFEEAIHPQYLKESSDLIEISLKQSMYESNRVEAFNKLKEKFHLSDSSIEYTPEIKAYFQKNKTTTPPWLKYFLPNFDESPLGEGKIENSSNSLLILLNIPIDKDQKRMFAVTAGFGYNFLNNSFVKDDFGLMVALNTLDTSGILSAESNDFEPNICHKSVKMSQETEARNLDITYSREYVRSISGSTDREYRYICNRVQGSTSAYISGKCDFSEIEFVCRELYNQYLKIDYETRFPEINQFDRIRDPANITLLSNYLIDNFGKQKAIMLIWNIGMGQEFIKEYKYKYLSFERTYSDLSIDILKKFRRSAARALRMRVADVLYDDIIISALDENGIVYAEIDDIISLCNGTVKYDGTYYIIYKGNWYNTGRYEIDMNKYLQNIKEINNENSEYLIPMKSKESEDDYIKKLKKRENSYKLHKDLIYIEGRGKIEICDLITTSGEFIHIKKYKNSWSDMSTLFMQGYNSAMILARTNKFNEKIKSKIPDFFEKFDPMDNEGRKNIEIVFAIAEKSDQPLYLRLPLNAKMVLMKVRRALEQMGFSVALCRIPIEA
jgi:uncharacterized protein (TIGR04141 family)